MIVNWSRIWGIGKYLVAATIIGFMLSWMITMLSGCATEIMYKDFSYKKPVLSNQQIDHLVVILDPNDPNTILRFEIWGQKSDSQAAMTIIQDLAKLGLSYNVGVSQ